MVQPVFYMRPAKGFQPLTVEPALASWDAADSPGQVRSAAFIDDACASLTDKFAQIPDPIALRLDVGLPGSAMLETHHDLDNYLFPLVPELSKRTGRHFASVWATKSHARKSFIAVEVANPTAEPKGAHSIEITTLASIDTTAYKEQIRDQLAAISPIPDGAVALQLAFIVGPRRAWPNLWKPTIDALGGLLGHEAGAKEWNPRDGRITDIALHCVTDPDAGNGLTIAIRAAKCGARPCREHPDLVRRPKHAGQSHICRRTTELRHLITGFS